MPHEALTPRLVVASLLMMALIAASLTAMLMLAVQKWRGAALLPPQEPRRAAPWLAVDLLLIVVIYVSLTIAASSPLLLFPGMPQEQKHLLLLAGNSVANLIAMAATIGFLRMVRGATWSDLGLATPRLLVDVGLGLFAFLALAVPIYGLQLFLNWLLAPETKHPIFEMFQTSPSVLLFVLAAIAAVIVAPLTEEFFFRCLLQGWLEKWSWPRDIQDNAAIVPAGDQLEAPPDQQPPQADFSLNPNPYAAPAAPIVSAPLPQATSRAAESLAIAGTPQVQARLRLIRAVAIVVSAAIFALMHIMHGVDVVALFLLALVLGVLYQRTGRLWPSVALHMALNGVSIAFFFLTI